MIRWLLSKIKKRKCEHPLEFRVFRDYNIYGGTDDQVSFCRLCKKEILTSVEIVYTKEREDI